MNSAYENSITTITNETNDRNTFSFGGLWAIEGVKEMVLLLFVLSSLSKFIHVHATLLGDLEAEKYACNFALGNRKRCCNAWKFQIKVFV